MSELHECIALLACGLPCLAFAEFDCRDGGLVCLKHSHPRSCCRNLFLEQDLAEEADYYADAYGIQCSIVVDNPEAIGDPNQTPRVRFVTHRMGAS